MNNDPTRARTPAADTPSVIPMNESQRRGITTTLRLLDETLCRFDEWAAGRERRSVLYRERNDLSREQRKRLRAAVARLRRILERVRDDLNLVPGETTASSDIWGACSGFWENLVELESRHLKRYGDVSPDLAEYMDDTAPQLVRGLEDILDVLSRAGSSPSPPAENDRSPSMHRTPEDSAV